jgi:hypothetical protein
MLTRPNAFEEFMMLFNALKHQAGTPQRLVTFFDTHPNMQEAVQQLDYWLLRTDFQRRVFTGKKIFRQVPDRFEQQWKEYEQAWAPALAHLQMRDILPELFGEFDPNARGFTTSEIELTPPDPEAESVFNPLYHDGGAALQIGIDMFDFELEHREDNLKSDFGTEDDERIGNMWRIARGAYDYLTNTIGIEPKDVFLRWRKVPEFFMPAHVSNKHGGEKGSLDELLNDAIRAYVAGAPAAAIAICPAALETILKEHYLPGKRHQYQDKEGRWRDQQLGELIVLAEEKYKHIQRGKIQPLTDKANGILHRYSRTMKLTKEDEQIIIDFMRTIKFLINRAKSPQKQL